MFSVFQYRSFTSGGYQVLLNCQSNLNRTHVIECGEDGQWNNNIHILCRQTTTISTAMMATTKYTNNVRISIEFNYTYHCSITST